MILKSYNLQLLDLSESVRNEAWMASKQSMYVLYTAPQPVDSGTVHCTKNDQFHPPADTKLEYYDLLQYKSETIEQIRQNQLSDLEFTHIFSNN